MRFRDLPLSRKIFAFVTLALMVFVPVYLIVHSDDRYDHLQLKRSSGSATAGGVRLLLKNEGGTTVEIRALEPNGRTAVRGSVRIGDDDGDEDEVRIVPFRRFLLGPLRKRVVVLTGPAECVRDLRIRFEVSSNRQDERLDLPEAVALPRGTACG